MAISLASEGLLPRGDAGQAAYQLAAYDVAGLTFLYLQWHKVEAINIQDGLLAHFRPKRLSEWILATIRSASWVRFAILAGRPRRNRFGSGAPPQDLRAAYQESLLDSGRHR